MELLTWFDESFPLRFALTLLHFLWQGCVVTLVVLIAGRLLRRASAAWRYVVNLTAMSVMVACLPVTFALVDVSHVGRVSRPDLDGFGEPSYEAFTSDSTSPLHPSVLSTEIDQANALADGSRSEPAAQGVAINHRSVMPVLSSHEPTDDDAPESDRGFAWIAPVAPYLTTIYFLGVAAMMCRLTSGLWGGLRLRRHATPVDEESLLGIVRRQAKRIGLKTAPAIAYCEQISIPVLIGIIKPTILLPAALASGLSPDQLQALVMHELAHIRRYDLLVNLLQRMIEAVLFFHPAVWYVSRRVSMERENAADDLVVTAGWQRVRYADALVRMAELSSTLRNTRMANKAAALAASGSNNTEFKRRILRLLDDDNRAKLRLTPISMAMLVAVVAFAVLAPLLVQTWAQSQGKKAEEADNEPSSMATQEHSSHSATIVDPAGQPVAGARVEFVAIETQTGSLNGAYHLVKLAQQAAITDHNGEANVSLPLASGWFGFLEIRASAPGMIRHHRDVWKPGEDPRVVLWPATPLRGRVLDPRGKPLAGAVVYGRGLLPKTEDADDTRLRRWADYVKTDANGEFTLPRPTGLEITLRVDSWAGVPMERSVEAEENDIGDVRLSAGTSVTGVVLDEAGETLSGIAIELKAADSEHGPASSYAAVLTDDDGGFRLPPRRGPMILALGQIAVPSLQPEIATVRTARDLPYVPQVVRLPGRNGEESRTIRAVPAVTIRGQINDSEGKPVPGRAKSKRGWYSREMTVNWRGNDAGNRRLTLGRCRIDQEGQYEFTIARGLNCIGLHGTVAGYPGHSHLPEPVADRDDPTIEFQKHGVILRNLDRDIHNLDWHLVRNEQRATENETSSEPEPERASHSATIVDPAGQPVAGAQVEFVAVETQSVSPSGGYHLVDLAKQAAVTDRRGAASVSLPLARGWDGFLDIRASAPGMIRHHRYYGEPIEDPRVVLWPAKPVVGRVVDWRGEPVAGAIVYGHCLLPQTKDAEDPRHRKWKDYTRTKGTGHFILTRPADMDIELRVCSHTGVPLHVSVDVYTDALGDLRLSPGTKVTGMVLDEDGKPTAGIVVKLTGADSEVEAAASDANVLTDEYGHFCLPPRRGQLILSLGDTATPWLSPEIATIRTTRHLHHVPELLDLSGRHREITRTIHAAPAITIQGQLADSDGKPVPGRVKSKRGWYCREVFASWGGNDAGNRSVWLDRCRIDDEGRYELEFAANVDAIRLWTWVAGYPGHDMTAVPVADKDDPMIEFHERGVNLHNLNRDIELNWRLAPSGQRGKVLSRSSQTSEVSTGDNSPSPWLLDLWEKTLKANLEQASDPGNRAKRTGDSKTTRKSPYDFRDSKAYAELESEQRLKLETVDRDLAVLEAALNRYMKDHEGASPLTLDALVPRYIAELPKDPFATEETAGDEDLGEYSPSLDGWGYRYRMRHQMAYAISSFNPLEVQSSPGSWEVRSVGLPDFPYRYESHNARGLYQRKGYWGRLVFDVF